MSAAEQGKNNHAQVKTEGGVNRREFIAGAMAATGVVLAGGTGLYSMGRYLIPPKQPERTRQVLVTTTEKVAPGKTFGFKDLNDREAMLVNLGDNRFKAFSAVCTHLGCLVKWDPAKQRFICPCHQGIFDANGNVVDGPPPQPLEEFPVEIREDKFLYVTFKV